MRRRARSPEIYPSPIPSTNRDRQERGDRVLPSVCLPVAYDVPVYAAQSLAEDEYVAFNACTHTELTRIPYSDFERLVKPIVAHFSTKKVSFDKQDEQFG